jgi:2'-5' RNA ligase
MRLFVGVKLGSEVERRATEGLERLKALAPRARWVVPEKLHLTLSFLGEVEPERAEAVARALEAVGVKHGPLVLKIEGGGSFGAPGHPRVLWAGVGGDTQALESLQVAVVSALEPLGFAAEERDYTAHLTLARARTPRGDRESSPAVRLRSFRCCRRRPRRG